jgi:hypothetical protein
VKGCSRKVSTSRSLLALLLVLAMATAACSSSETEPESSPAEAPTQGARSLIVLRRNALVRVDLASGEEQRLGRVPTPDVFPIPGSPGRFLLVGNRGAGEDFAADPRLSVIDQTGRSVQRLGAGYSPLADLAGERVAFLRSAGDRACEGEICLGAVAVFVADLGGDVRPLLPPGDWHLISWAGDALIVSTRGRTYRATERGELEKVPVLAGDVWGATPAGDQLVLVRRNRVELMDLESGERDPTELDALLAEGEWNLERNELLAVAVDGRATRLVRMTGDGSATTVAGSDGASGPVLWAGDAAFAYVRADGLELEAVLCEEDDECRSVLRWAEGVVPLALQ